MGEPNVTTTPRTNTFSPTKGRSLAFGCEYCSGPVRLNRLTSPFSVSAPSPSSPLSSTAEFNRSALQQRTLFGGGGFQPTSPSPNYANVSQLNHSTSIAGPPTQSLFDSLRTEQNTVVDQSFTGKPMPPRQLSQSIANQSVCDPYLNQSNFNVSRIASPADQSYDYRNTSMAASCLSPTAMRPSNYWITVYGFSSAATPMILSHFSQCGTILEKVFPPHSGNWVHLRFASSLECDKALNYHERILANSIMIGVTHCRDPSIVDKENVERNK